MANQILITGATGMVGKQLIPALQALGYNISILTRKQTKLKDVKVYLWDIDKQTIDANALKEIDTIIHLAGEGIGDKKWTKERKKQIIASRVRSTQLLYQTIKTTNSPVKTFISAAAVGIYGDRAEEILSEKSTYGNGFLSECCIQWEAAADEGLPLGLRVVKIRIGLILSKDGGTLTAMEKPVKYFVGSPLGNGKQWMPWIHMDDIVGIFTKAVQDEKMEGAFNACSPMPVTNKMFVKQLAKKLNRPIWPINVPKFVLKAILGEMSILPLMSTNTTAQKILDAGYLFKYVNIDAALDSIYQ